MANYAQFKSKHPEYKSLYYICGAELSLRLEVLDSVINQWEVRVGRFVDVTKNSFSTVENVLLMVKQELNVVVLENVDKLDESKKEWLCAKAYDVINGNLPQTILICHTSEENPETSLPLYRPFVEKGRFVECKTMSVENMKKYAIQDYGCTESAANALCELVSYNFMQMNNELEKLAYLKQDSANTGVTELDEKTIREYVVFSAENLFISNMLNRNTEQALKNVSAVPIHQISSILTILVKKLSYLYLIITNDAPGTRAHDLAASIGLQPWQTLEYFQIKRYWSSQQVLDKLKLLVSFESYYCQYSSNVLPLLISWW